MNVGNGYFHPEVDQEHCKCKKKKVLKIKDSGQKNNIKITE